MWLLVLIILPGADVCALDVCAAVEAEGVDVSAPGVETQVSLPIETAPEPEEPREAPPADPSPAARAAAVASDPQVQAVAGGSLGFALLSALAFWKVPIVARTARWIIATTGGLLGLVLFSRIQGDAALRHPTREAMAEMIEAEPGIHVEEIRRRLGIATTTALHHLKRLESNGFVQVERHGNRRRYFPSGTQVARARGDWVLLAHRTPRRIAQAILASPGTSQTEICQRLGLQKPAASKHLKTLTSGGLVEVEKEGRRCAYTPSPRLAQVLALQ